MRIAVALAALLALALSTWAAPLDPEAFRQGGDIAYRRALQPAAEQRKLNQDRSVTARIRQLANRIVVAAPAINPAASSMTWTVNVVTDPAPEAIDYPGGRLLVHTGLGVQAGLADDEVAAILAHVMAHGLLGHDRRRVEAAVSEADAKAADPNRRALAVADAVGRVLKRPATPEEIDAADRTSIDMLARAAYDPRAAAKAWRRLATAGGPLVERYPVADTRLAALEAAAERALPVYEETRAKAAAQPQAPPPRGGSTRSIR